MGVVKIYFYSFKSYIIFFDYNIYKVLKEVCFYFRRFGMFYKFKGRI